MAKRIKKIDEVLKNVFEAIRCGNSLYGACVKYGITTKEFYNVLAENQDAKENYWLALADYADQCTDAIRGITANLKAGEIDNSTAKLLIETEKWLAQKACPDVISGKINFDNNSDDDMATEIVVKFV